MEKIDSEVSSNLIILKALKLINNGYLEENRVEQLANALKISELQLEKFFIEKKNITPLDYTLLLKLSLAQKLLTDTNLNIDDIVDSLNFENIKMFNTLFEKTYKISPIQFRNQNKSLFISDTLKINISYPTPYRYDTLLKHLSYFSIKGVEKVENGRFYKNIRVKKNNKYINGYIIVGNNESENFLEVIISETLIKVLLQVVGIIKNIFDLISDPLVIYDTLQSSNLIIKNAFTIGTRIPGCYDAFENCVRAIIGQLISMKNASDVLTSFCKKFGEKIKTNIEGLDYVFPTPESIYAINKQNMYDELCSLHITRTKANAIMEIAHEICNNAINIKYCAHPQELINRLKKIKGIGKWTADHIALRSIEYSDVLMETDYNISKIFEKEKITDLSIFDKFSPWKSYLTVGIFELKESIMEKQDRIYKTNYQSPIGNILLGSQNKKLVGLWIEGQKNFLSNFKEEEMIEKNDDEILLKTKLWLDKYFNHEKPLINELNLAPVGSKLKQDIWNILKTVPYGRHHYF